METLMNIHIQTTEYEPTETKRCNDVKILHRRISKKNEKFNTLCAVVQ